MVVVSGLWLVVVRGYLYSNGDIHERALFMNVLKPVKTKGWSLETVPNGIWRD